MHTEFGINDNLLGGKDGGSTVIRIHHNKTYRQIALENDSPRTFNKTDSPYRSIYTRFLLYFLFSEFNM